MKETVLLVCDCGGNAPSLMDAVASSRIDADAYVIRDLCGAALAKPAELSRIIGDYRRQIVLACYPRAARALLAQCGVDAPAAEFVNLRDGGLSASLDEARTLGLGAGETRVNSLDSGLDVPSWFPVIDRERCVKCGICSDFCLFGVYRREAGEIPQVTKPLNCKNNCPACARICPNGAIYFPKIAERGTIAGADVEASPARSSVPKAARSSLLRTDAREGIERNRLSALAETGREGDAAHD